MKLVFTEQASESLIETLEFIASQGVSNEKLVQIRDQLLNRAESLLENPYSGQKEEYLAHLELGHRRLIEKHCKIIYRLEKEMIYVTDIFDTRQDPSAMKG